MRNQAKALLLGGALLFLPCTNVDGRASPIELPIEKQLVLRLDVEFVDRTMRVESAHLEPGVAARNDASPKEFSIQLLNGDGETVDVLWFGDPLNIRVYMARQSTERRPQRRGLISPNGRTIRTPDLPEQDQLAVNPHGMVGIPELRATYYVPFSRGLKAVEFNLPRLRNQTRFEAQDVLRPACKEMLRNEECRAWLRANPSSPQ